MLSNGGHVHRDQRDGSHEQEENDQKGYDIDENSEDHGYEVPSLLVDPEVGDATKEVEDDVEDKNGVLQAGREVEPDG